MALDFGGEVVEEGIFKNSPEDGQINTSQGQRNIPEDDKNTQLTIGSQNSNVDTATGILVANSATTTWTDIPNVDGTITIDSASSVLVLCLITWNIRDVGGDLYLRITRDNETANSFDIWEEAKASSQHGSSCISWVDTPGSAGTYAYEPQYKTNSDTSEVDIFDTTIICLELKGVTA